MERAFICEYKECNQYFTEPITLPCGNNICKKHVEENLFPFGVFFCSSCDAQHEVPEYGFPINKSLNRIISKNSHLNNDKHKILNSLNKLQISADDLDLVIKDPERFIYDYVANLKNKVDLERERLINQINETSDGLINRLKQFEAECKQKLDESKDFIEQNGIFLRNVINQKDNWIKEVLFPDITVSKTKEMTKEIRHKIDEVKDKLIDYKNFLLNDKGSNFNPNNLQFTENYFGDFKIEEWLSIKNQSNERRNNILNSQLLSAAESIDLLKLCEFDIDSNKFELIYRATDDGFQADDFHRKCDGQPSTLTIIKEVNNKYVFGGYTQASWDKSAVFKSDEKAFLFSFKNKTNNPLKLSPLEPMYSIYCSDYGGPMFGRGYDIYVSNNSHENDESYVNLGVSFNHPPSLSTLNDGYLAGDRTFKTENIEVYKVL